MFANGAHERADSNQPTSGDKAELLNEMSYEATIPRSESSSTDQSEMLALKKPKMILEAGKAILQDQSRGLRIIVICAVVFSVIITIALILSIYLGPPQIGANAAVATDVKECSDIGLTMLEKGGNAVDAAVAAMFCLGVVNAESSGIGGGGFMLIHNHKLQQSEVFDFRETAPSGIKLSMYNGDKNKIKLGTLAIGVPGELKGMEAAHKKYGKLSWNTVVTPAATLANNGFKMTGHTEFVMKQPKFDLDYFMKSKLAKFYTINNSTLKVEGDLIVRTDLARTLHMIANEGSSVLYSGTIGNDIVAEIANAASPGVLTKADLENYEVEIRDIVQTTYQGYTVESVPAPGSGPVLLSILNILEGYLLQPNGLSYHHILEAFKFAYAQRELLGDPKFHGDQVQNATKTMISKEEATRIRNVTYNETMEASFYNSLFGLPEDEGTTHVSVIDTAELMVSVTSTINGWFGSMVMTDSGVLLNNQMADFNQPGSGSELNVIAPGKRPLSSMSPTVVYESGHLCGLRMVCGAANGTRIITGIVLVLLNNLTFGWPLERAVSEPRIHNELYPDAKVVEAEDGFSYSILEYLAKQGHSIQMMNRGQNSVTAVLKIKDGIEATVDTRKKGAGVAMFG